MSGSRTLMYETGLSSSPMLLWSSHLRTGSARIALGGVDRFAAKRLQEGERIGKKRLDLTDRGLAVRVVGGTAPASRAVPRRACRGPADIR